MISSAPDQGFFSPAERGWLALAPSQCPCLLSSLLHPDPARPFQLGFPLPTPSPPLTCSLPTPATALSSPVNSASHLPVCSTCLDLATRWRRGAEAARPSLCCLSLKLTTNICSDYVTFALRFGFKSLLLSLQSLKGQGLVVWGIIQGCPRGEHTLQEGSRISNYIL